MTDENLHVRIWRGGGQDAGRFVDYTVPRRDSQTVLDVVTYVQRTLDPTLSYRFACRVGMCGDPLRRVVGVLLGMAGGFRRVVVGGAQPVAQRRAGSAH